MTETALLFFGEEFSKTEERSKVLNGKGFFD